MSAFEEHCVRCQEILGAPFVHVHLWLDAFYGQEPYGSRHRYLRHHQKGIDHVKKEWGDKAAKAAEIHIRQDLNEEGYPSDKPIPADGKEYKKAGLW